jgi:subtilisin family serine protease
VLFSKDFAADDGALDTGDFHGTNVAAIIVGVAPGARLIGLDVFDADGSGAWSTLIAAINWAVDSKAKYNITAANLSLGGGKYDSECHRQTGAGLGRL